MKPFLSSTLIDLAKERLAVLNALSGGQAHPLAMEYFLATPTTPAETALAELKASDVVVLVIGFKAGSLLPDGTGRTYTEAEYDEALRLGKDVLVFLKQERSWFRRTAHWKNKERDPAKKKALEKFRARVGTRYTWDYFETPDRLALQVVLALHAWEARGRPGARKTFASIDDYYVSKNPAMRFRLLDFKTTLLGRNKELAALEDFLADSDKQIAIVIGRGGIGKSKLLHDWAQSHATDVLFLKDQPLWHRDSEKEIPANCKILIADDAHRLDSLPRLLQLLQETAKSHSLKLVLSTRPGGVARLTQSVYRFFTSSEIVQFPGLTELSKEQSRTLASQVLRSEFQPYATHLAEIGSNSPLVIVAGGNLIAARRINPALLTTLEELRSEIFHRLLDEIDLNESSFAVKPRIVLSLIAVLGPINVERSEFQDAARRLLGFALDEILSTIDSLAATGIVTPRPEPVRVIPDVLSDWLAEDCCLGTGGRSTRYADRVYREFGAYFLKNLMLSLAELDWRKGQAGETGLNLLDDIWADIRTRFQVGNEYVRHNILKELAPASSYQPIEVLNLVRMALDSPVVIPDSEIGHAYRLSYSHVLSLLPTLLEGTAYHPDYIHDSVLLLWRLAKEGSESKPGSNGAQVVLTRLASWHRYKDAAVNFGMLLQAIRLTKRPDAFAGEYTPFEIIRQLLERDGRFEELGDDEWTISFGRFGLNGQVVGPVRRSALDYLDSVLDDGDTPAIYAVQLMESLLHNHLNSMGRISSTEELTWQDLERERCLEALLRRYSEPSTIVLKARIYNALRSATAINCPEWVRERASAAVQSADVSDEVAVTDALCTAIQNLPILSANVVTESWERSIAMVMQRGKASLERLAVDVSSQVTLVSTLIKDCLAVRVTLNGFGHFMSLFAGNLAFLDLLADSIAQDRELSGLLALVLGVIHTADASAFRRRAFAALNMGNVEIINACANNLRVLSGASEEDVALMQAYAEYPSRVAKLGVSYAAAYMGKFTRLLPALKTAVLAIDVEEDEKVAAELSNAFGFYGIPLATLTRQEASVLAAKFVSIDDWDTNQGSISRFLNQFVHSFPDEAFDMLVARIERSGTARAQHRAGFRTFGLVYGSISFAGVPSQKLMELTEKALQHALLPQAEHEYIDLFWNVAGDDDRVFSLILDKTPSLQEMALPKLAALLNKAAPCLISAKLPFVRDLLRMFQGPVREQLIDAIAYQSYRQANGVFTGTSLNETTQERHLFDNTIDGFLGAPELDDLAAAFQRLYVGVPLKRIGKDCRNSK